MISWDLAESRYRSYKEETREGAGAERRNKLHAKGKLTARERMEILFDEGKYSEIGMYQKSRIDFGDVKKTHYPGDGVITAVGKINGVTSYAVSQDFTISGGAGGEAHVDKICRVLEMAIENRAPIVYLCESGGARIEEGILSLAAYSRLFRLNTIASGMIPQIAAVMGNCAGGSSYSPAMCDFIFIVKAQGQFFITGPKVIKALTGEDITMDELGGAEIHSKHSGQVHFVSDNDDSCINDIRRLLRFVTINHVGININKKTYRKEKNRIERIVPENKKIIYNVKDVIYELVDDEFMEVQEEFAPNIVCGFSRIDGITTGIIANQPNHLGGALDCDAADKGARFVRFCDCFNIQLLVLVDVPGFFPGLEQEKKGVLRHGCKLLYAFAEASVPKISVIMRKAYGGAYCAMNSKDLGADYVFAWPISEIAVMGADGAVEVIFNKMIAASDKPNLIRTREIQKYEEKYLNPYFAASYGMVDSIIMPSETRDEIITIYESLRTKKQTRIEKKHGNIAL